MHDEPVGRGIVRWWTYLIGTGDNSRESAFFLPLAFHHGLQDGWVVGAEIDEDMANTALVYCQRRTLTGSLGITNLPKGLEERKRCGIDPVLPLVWNYSKLPFNQRLELTSLLSRKCVYSHNNEN